MILPIDYKCTDVLVQAALMKNPITDIAVGSKTIENFNTGRLFTKIGLGLSFLMCFVGCLVLCLKSGREEPHIWCLILIVNLIMITMAALAIAHIENAY